MTSFRIHDDAVRRRPPMMMVLRSDPSGRARNETLFAFDVLLTEPTAVERRFPRRRGLKVRAFFFVGRFSSTRRTLPERSVLSLIVCLVASLPRCLGVDVYRYLVARRFPIG